MSDRAEQLESGGASPPRWHAALIALAGVFLLIGCWGAGFSGYDDPHHVTENAQLARGSLLHLFEPVPISTYFPITLLSYKLDQLLFQSWMPGLCGSYAPGVRTMTLLYHIGAALLLWRIVLRLGLSSRKALFIALVFAGHPLACETVCWVSERKNALAGLFGFAALWAWLRYEGSRLRVPIAFVLYALALMSKPSALGLLPIFAILDFFGGTRGLHSTDAAIWKPRREWLFVAARVLPLALLAAAAVAVNIRGHGPTIIAPPGGTVFTALLTDLEILSRYLLSLLAPIQLSAVYFVEPIRSMDDLRIWKYGLPLLLVVLATIGLATNRRLAFFGWFWFLAALGPSLNLIALPHLMQDRYIYLSTPGFLLVLVSAASGIPERLKSSLQSPLRAVGVAYLAMLLCFSVQRSFVWDSMKELFEDAVRKQPQASYAWYGLGQAYAGELEELSTSGAAASVLQEKKLQWMNAWMRGLDEAPDFPRFLTRFPMALSVGREYFNLGKLSMAEKYWKLAAHKFEGMPDDPFLRAKALASLSALRTAQDRPQEALMFAEDAYVLAPDPDRKYFRARAAIRFAERLPAEHPDRKRFLLQARDDLQSIQATAHSYSDAQKELQNPLLQF